MRHALLAATAIAAVAVPAAAEEGMWLPSQTGAIADQLRQAGMQLDPAKLGNLNQPPLTAIASLGGCSAAFLSPQGLVATNHHCVYGSIQYNSKPGQDYLTDGFLARTMAEELPAAPGSRIYVIEDLRDQMLAGVADTAAMLEDIEHPDAASVRNADKTLAAMRAAADALVEAHAGLA